MRAPDRNAPRFRYKFTDLLTTETVQVFKEKFPQYKDYKDMDLVRALGVHNKIIAKHVRDNRDGVELQGSLGYIFIGMVDPATKKKRPNIAWNQSIQLGIRVVHKNWETDNKIGKIYYCNYSDQYRFENRQLWAFTACKPFKKEASQSIRKNWQMYTQIDPNHHIWQMFERRRKKNYFDDKRKEDLADYNEFELED